MMTTVATAHVHRWASRLEAADVNAYLVETDNAVVAVDSTLTVTDSRALRSRLPGDAARRDTTEGGD
jgi:hypothetical protein